MDHYSENIKIDKAVWHKSITINQGNSKNKLKIVCNNHKIVGWINDQRVYLFEDNSLNFGQVGVTSRIGKNTPASVYFDNILIKTKSE